MVGVAQSAGLSRGALTHHFATKEELVVRSISYQLDQVTASLNNFAASAGSSTHDVGDTVDHLWAVMSGGLFYITMEYLPEARHNQPFRDGLVPVVQRFHDALDLVWARLAGGNERSHAGAGEGDAERHHVPDPRHGRAKPAAR